MVASLERIPDRKSPTMNSTPNVLSEVGLVETRTETATAENSSASEPAGPSNGISVKSMAEKSDAAVAEFLRVIDELPQGSGLKRLRDKFVEMNTADRTDEEFLLSPAFRNILKLAVIRCRERPAKAKIHIREVVDNMILNTPKTPEERQKLRALQQRKIKEKRSSETLLERTYLALDTVLKKIRVAELREESDDDDSSVETNYVYTGRLKQRAVDLLKNIQKLQGNRYSKIAETEPPIVVRCTQYPEINRGTAKMAKRCIRRGLTPDYYDVLVIVKRISEQDNLGMSEETKRSVAGKVFKEIMDQIKKRRNKEYKRNMESLAIELSEKDEEDPATKDEQLRRRLEEQAIEGRRKIDSVINQYADEQAKGRAGSGSETDEPQKKKAKLQNGSDNGQSHEQSHDSSGNEDGDGASGERDSSAVSDVDERYLDTESSENEESEDIDCDEIIKRFGQDRERPRVEVAETTSAPTATSLVDTTVDTDALDNGIDSKAPKEEQSCDIIELSSSDEDTESSRIRPPRRVFPKRLSTLGRPLEHAQLPEIKKDAGSGADNHDDGDMKSEPSQEVIEISD